MPDVAVPHEPQELTPAWLSAALGVPVAAVAVAELDAFGVGGRLFVVRPRYAAPGALPATLVAKLAPADAEGRRRLDGLGAFRTEVGFYADVHAGADVATPRCYYAAYEPGDGYYAILMQDLREGRTGRDEAGLTTAEARAVARALGRLHARWWGVPALGELDWLRHWEGSLARLGRLVGETATRTMARFRADIDPRLLPLIAELPTRLPSLPERLAGRPLTLVHGDIQPRNIIFTGPPRRPAPVLLDWSSAVRGPGALDLCNLLGICIEPGRRRAAEAQLFDAYLGELPADARYSREQAAADYRWLLQYRLARTLVVGALAADAAGVAAMTGRNLRRVGAALLDAGYADGEAPD